MGEQGLPEHPKQEVQAQPLHPRQPPQNLEKKGNPHDRQQVDLHPNLVDLHPKLHLLPLVLLQKRRRQGKEEVVHLNPKKSSTPVWILGTNQLQELSQKQLAVTLMRQATRFGSVQPVASRTMGLP